MYEGIRTIYLIHHSHTDVGYTHDQPVVWDLHRRFLYAALDAAERTADADADHAFRWTVETTYPLLRWLESASSRDVERFVELARAGRIEVTAMPVNITPLYDTDQLAEALRPVERIRSELGLPVRYAMNSDVNGQNWPLVDVLLKAGIEGFTMATNIHFGGSPLWWPNAFRWQGPSGRSILAWNGWDYGFAHDLGVDRDLDGLRESWPRVDAWLRERRYPLPVLMLQLYDRFGDNGSASATVSGFVREWNERVGEPRLRLALPSEWWAAVREHEGVLPAWRGDWTDYWNFGCGSSAREVAINRASRRRLRAADAASAALCGEHESTREGAQGTRERAWRSLNLWDEHTWGADHSVWHPEYEDTTSQWHHKAHYAYEARSLSLLLQRDAVAELARRVERGPDDALLVFNPTQYPVRLSGPLPWHALHGIRGRGDDPTAPRHFLDRSSLAQPDTHPGSGGEISYLTVEPTDVPAHGYAVVSESDVRTEAARVGDDAVVETASHRVELDRERGGILSWRSKRLGREVVDRDAPWPLGGWVREAPVPSPDLSHPRRAFWAPVERRLGLERGWRPGWKAERTGPSRLLEHRAERLSDGVTITQRLEQPSGRALIQRVYVPEHEEWIEIAAEWEMGLETDPEATYVAFPLAVAGPTARVDLGGQAMRVHEDQLPRACRDYYTVQGWADLSNEEMGVTVATPDAPMVQLGGFNFGANLESVELERPMILGWVTNNYWETNFRAHQPGWVRARYRLLPHTGPFDEAEAHRFASEASSPLVFQHLHETPVEGTSWPREGSLLRLPSAPVLTLHVWPDGDDICLRILNASDTSTETEVGSGVLGIDSAGACDLFGAPLSALEVRDGLVSLVLGPRELRTLRLRVAG